ncbi:Checkpoint protein hus1 [Exophiala dermatitidis]|nr:Checkpoint protein hus1 [Exophiala dermatitidis]KAJ4524128.1 Checkpoint protein hus1 [Exophiala dermatitidis]KAJ4555482.1 Checkpoint protein hus1 [Exophiala dermatitidis]KAJ4556359.1 Checkpoint protein hus1 [Exophiala dermatitidis]KAJ4568787.1 Checkpoint protein hus1 [Exophiala dermatitidis]
MRFKSQIKNVNLFAKFCASLASLGQIAWCRLNDDDVQFTIIPDKGSQVWSVLKPETVFESYILQSASPKNTINLEVPIQALSRALKSAYGSTSAQIRLTKKDNVPMLSLTIVTNTFSSGNSIVAPNSATGQAGAGGVHGEFDSNDDMQDASFIGANGGGARERETIITQDIPVKVLSMEVVERIHQPRTQEPDVNIYLPPLAQIKTISDRFTRLAIATTKGSSSASPRLELSANMHGSLKISVRTDALNITSRWTGLANPELDPAHFPDGSQGVRDHPSTRMKQLGGTDGENEAGWSKVRIDAKDWSRVLSVGRVSARVIACFINEGGLVLYVYLPNDESGSEDESCLTVSFESVLLPEMRGSPYKYYVSSFSA